MGRGTPADTVLPERQAGPARAGWWSRAFLSHRHLAGPVAIIGAVFFLLTWLGWLRWGEVVIDFGRQVYLPWQICAGKVLYRDLASTYGPLSPYLNAAMFWLFGASIRTLVLVNLALLMLSTVLVFNLLSGVASRWTATTGCVVFLAVFGFGHNLGLGNYNYICPYAHEITHGMLFSLLSIFLFWQHVRRGAAFLVALSGVSCGLVLLAKPELFIACLLAIVSGLGGKWLIGRPATADRLRAAAAFLAGMVSPAIVAFGFFLTATSPRTAILSALGAWPPVFNRAVRSIPFYAIGVGTQHGGANALRAAVWAALLLAYLWLFWAIGSVVRRRGWPPRALAWLSGTVGFVALSRFLLPRLWIGVARPLPLFLIVIGGFALAGVRDVTQDLDQRRKNLLLLSLSVFGLFALAKMLFNVYLGHFGFVLAMPGALVAFVALVERLPEKAAGWGSSPAVVRAGGVALVALVVLAHAGSSIITLRKNTAPLGTGPDRLMTTPVVARDATAMLALIDRTLSPSESLAVIPEGALLNYLTKRVNPTPYLMLTPTEFANYGEGRILEAFRANPPAAILYMPRRGSQMGVGYLGTDYGAPLIDWIKANYFAIARSQPSTADAAGLDFVLLRRLPSDH